LWFSFVSATTIGYGDVTPVSFIGRFLSSTFALFGIICIAILTANIIDLNASYDEEASD
jgi:voltage-gated potassium channel